jgi:hypothetical protein
VLAAVGTTSTAMGVHGSHHCINDMINTVDSRRHVFCKCKP